MEVDIISFPRCVGEKARIQFTRKDRRWACFSARFEFKFQDMWIGAFWKKDPHKVTACDIWICFIPCVPLHISVWWGNGH